MRAAACWCWFLTRSMQVLQLGSPPGSGQGSITTQSWPVTVEAQYSPDQLRLSRRRPHRRGVALDKAYAELTRRFEQTAAGFHLDRPGNQLVTQLASSLNFDVDLVLRSLSGSPPTPDSTLALEKEKHLPNNCGERTLPNIYHTACW